MIRFQYHPTILQRYPRLRAAVICAQGLHNGPTSNELSERYLAQQRHVLQDIGDLPLSEIESLSAWRAAFRDFGVNPTRYRSAVEALLRRLTKKGDIPSINILVDLVNLISIRHAIPVACFDTRDIQGAVTVCFANGTERFTPLGEPGPEHPEVGEVIFIDQAGLVIARRWCWRQSVESAARLETVEALFTIEALHADAEASVRSALEDLLDLIGQFAGGKYVYTELGPIQPAFST